MVLTMTTVVQVFDRNDVSNSLRVEIPVSITRLAQGKVWIDLIDAATRTSQ